MTKDEYARKLDQLDRLLNDPDVPMQPAQIWSLLAELSQRDLQGGSGPRRAPPAGPPPAPSLTRTVE